MKECISCHVNKPIDEYYSHPAMKDGHLNKCKECMKRDVRLNYRENIDHYKKYERNRLSDGNRREKRKEYSRELRKNDPEKVKLYHSRYDETQKKATHKLNNYLRTNKEYKKPCAICGDVKSEGHHEDYSKPLEVIWLCRKHHCERHMMIRDKEAI